MKKALVTGGAGFIGSFLVERLISEGFQVKVIDNLSSGRLENISPKVEFIQEDLKNFELVNKVLKDIDVVFHFAANPEVRVSTTNPEIHFKENIVATFNVLEAMRKNDVKELVFASSSSVYGEPEEIPVDESAPIRPVSVYGASKAACENLIHAYSKLYGIRAIILRYANVIGPRLRHGVIYDLLMKLKKDKSKLEILGDGKQVRSYIYIDDAIEATMIAYERGKGNFEVYNVASEDWITIDEIVEILLQKFKLGSIEIIHKPMLHGIGWLGDVKRIALKINKLKSLGYKPAKGSEEAIIKIIKDLQNEGLI